MAIGPQVTLPPIPHCNTIERIIAGRLVSIMLDEGFWVSVYDGEETTVSRSTDPAVIFPAMASTESDVLNFGRVGNADRAGWFLLIWGNGRDLISDYSDNEASNALFKLIDEWVDKELA